MTFKMSREERYVWRLLPAGRPVILNLVYFECPMLCTEVLNGLTSALK